MRLLTLLLAAALLSTAADAQKRPPKKVSEKIVTMDTTIFSKPLPKSLTPYQDVKGAYSVVFGRKPEHFEDVRKGTLYTVDRAVRQGASTQSITVLRLPTEVSPEFAYETFRKSLDKPPESSIKTEAPTEVDGRKGLLFDGRVGSKRKVSRIIVDGNRVFEFTFDIENWPLIEQVPKLAAEADEEIARYFGSIKIFAEVPETIPIDVLGEWKDGEYVNEYIGFRLPFDATWTVVELDDLNRLKKVGASVFRPSDQQTRDRLDEALKNDVMVGALRRDKGNGTGPSVIISLKKIGPYFTIWEIAESSMEIYTKLRNFKVVGAMTSARIGGEQCISWQTEGQIGAYTVYQNSYLFVRRGYAVSFVVSSLTKDELGELSKAATKVLWDPPRAVKKAVK